MANLEFYCEPGNDENHALELGFKFNMTNSPSFGAYILSWPKYNSTYTMLRVDINGDLRMYTYDEHIDYSAWEVTFVLFDRDEGRESECKLPRRCGSIGVCQDDQCVACPKPQGLLGWSKSCAPPMLPPCEGESSVGYYKIDGVEHFTSAHNEGNGPLRLSQCKDRCSKDCKDVAGLSMGLGQLELGSSA